VWLRRADSESISILLRLETLNGLMTRCSFAYIFQQ